MVCAPESLLVLSRVPGRMRLHLPNWTGEDVERVENCLRRVRSVQKVQANPLTGNILVHFDHKTIDEKSLLAELGEAWGKLLACQGLLDEKPPVPVARWPLRIIARGLLGHAVVDSLWFGAGFLGSAMGLPLAGLGPLHVFMDIAVWTMALAGERRPVGISTERRFLVLASTEKQRILS